MLSLVLDGRASMLHRGLPKKASASSAPVSLPLVTRNALRTFEAVSPGISSLSSISKLNAVVPSW